LRSAEAVKHCGCQFSDGVVIFYDENVLGLRLTQDRSPEAVVPAFTLSSQDRIDKSAIWTGGDIVQAPASPRPIY
jgi:hypothetical protein